MSAANPLSNVVGSTDPDVPLYLTTGALNPQAQRTEQEQKSIASHKKLAEYMQRNGGIPLPAPAAAPTQHKTTVGTAGKGRKGRPASKGPQTVPQPVIISPRPIFDVGATPEPAEESYVLTANLSAFFETDVARIKIKLVDLIESAMGYLLIFTDEDSVVFEPKTGTSLVFGTKEFKQLVFYPGTLFSAGDGTQYMVLIKQTEEETQN